MRICSSFSQFWIIPYVSPSYDLTLIFQTWSVFLTTHVYNVSTLLIRQGRFKLWLHLCQTDQTEGKHILWTVKTKTTSSFKNVPLPLRLVMMLIIGMSGLSEKTSGWFDRASLTASYPLSTTISWLPKNRLNTLPYSGVCSHRNCAMFVSTLSAAWSPSLLRTASGTKNPPKLPTTGHGRGPGGMLTKLRRMR